MNTGPERFKSLLNVSRETIDTVKIYESLLRKWNPAINLVSKSTLDDIWSRHFLDSAQIWQLRPPEATTWLDLGSGGGFPGLVISVLAKEQAPDLKVTLVESDIRKATFLQNASREMGVSPDIFTQRVENLHSQAADVISARALAPLPKLLSYADRHTKNGTICLFSKGENYESELTEAQKSWTFNFQKTPSITSSGGIILRIGDIGRVRPQ